MTQLPEPIVRKAIEATLRASYKRHWIGGDGRMDPGEWYYAPDFAEAVDGLLELWRRVRVIEE